MKKIIKGILIIVVMALISTKVYATTGTIKSDNVRIRKEANTNSEILTLVSVGDKVEVIETEGEWTKVKHSNFTGYIRNDMLEIEQNTEIKEENTNNEENTQNTNNETTEKKDRIKKDSSYTVSSKIDLKIVPSINSSIVANISENSNIQVKDIINKWCYVENGTSCGWILKSKIESSLKEENVPEESEKETSTEEKTDNTNTEEEEKETKKEENKKEENEINETKYVSVSALNLRKEANSNSEVIDQLDINTKVTVTAIVDNTWGKITYNGKTGYVAYKYLSDSKTAVTSRSENVSRETKNSNESANESNASQAVSNNETSKSSESSSGSVTGADIIAYAKQFLGCSYVYGGTTPSGFDCSGFTSYVYRHFGYSLNRTSSGQRSNGVAVDKSNLKAGDVVCFNGHVGLYIGGGSFIHAANPSKGVIISSLSESYYSKNYITARRIL